MINDKIQKEFKSIALVNNIDKINGLGRGIISTPDVDSHNDIVLPEAINENELKGLAINIEHNENREVGVVIDGWKSDSKTGSDFRIIEKKAKQMLASGRAGLSIEYYAKTWEDESGNTRTGTREENKYTGKRILKEIKMLGLAMTMIPSNKNCQILEYKSANMVNINQYPIAPYNAKFVNQKDELKDFLNIAEPNEVFSNCFLWYNDDMPESFDSYQMQYVGVYDNQLMIFPSAVNEIKNLINNNAMIEDKDKIQSKLNELTILINQDLNKKVEAIMSIKDIHNYISSVSDLSSRNIDILLNKINLKNNLTNKNNEAENKSASDTESQGARDLSASSTKSASDTESKNQNRSILNKLHNSFNK